MVKRPRGRGAAFAFVILSVAVGLALTVATLALISHKRLTRSWAVPLIELPDVEAARALEEGGRLYVLHGCAECHGDRLQGNVLIERGPLGRYVAPNLTRGEGGVAAQVDDDARLARAVRHGVGVDGRSLRLMPVDRYTHLTDRDVAALVAYLRHAEPVDGALPATRVALGGRILHALGFLELDTARAVDHAAPRRDPGEPAVTASYGRYVAALCAGCHGADLNGADPNGADRGGADRGGSGGRDVATGPVAGNLTPHSDGLAGWRFDEFERAVRRGVARDGGALDAAMPIERLALLTDTELWALWTYLQQLPPLPSAE